MNDAMNESSDLYCLFSFDVLSLYVNNLARLGFFFYRHRVLLLLRYPMFWFLSIYHYKMVRLNFSLKNLIFL